MIFFLPKSISESKFRDKLSQIEIHLEAQEGNFSFANGTSGIGWLFEYLNQDQGIDYSSELCLDFDERIRNVLLTKKWNQEIEFIFGITGIGVYLTRRALKVEQNLLLGRLIDHLEESSTNSSLNFISWIQPIDSIFIIDKKRASSEYNLGLAHGIPGIISLLISIIESPTTKKKLKNRALRLLRLGVNWLISRQNNVDTTGSFFSYSTSSINKSRLAWCYGDLTIALTLLRAGQLLNDNSLIDKATEISLFSCLRDYKDAEVDDIFICHGSAGISLIFKILFDYLKIPELENASLNWLEITLKNYTINKESIYADNKTGLLEGVSGVGLCLLHFIAKNRDWKDCLLLGNYK